MQDAAPKQIRIERSELRAVTAAIARNVQSLSGRCYFVGGCVRDAALGRAVGEIDLEVHGVDPDRLHELISSIYRCDRVGRAFEVLRLRGLPVDVSVAPPEAAGQRPDRAGGARDEIQRAAARRDFTINSMAVDMQSGEWIDPFGGRADLDAGILRHTSDRFVEDPLRVLRGMQLAARFRLRAAPETLTLCARLSADGLPRDRIFAEWRRLLVDGECPSLGLDFLRESGWLRDHPEFEALIGCAQDPRWHPEGDVWTHTLASLDAHAQSRSGNPREDLITGLAVLCHDLGKPVRTHSAKGRTSSHGHEVESVRIAEGWLDRTSPRRDLAPQVLPLVRWHLSPPQLYRDGAGDAAVRRLAKRVGRLDRLLVVAKADHQGRGELGTTPFAAGEWLRERALELGVLEAATPPLLGGEDLLALGARPGPELGRLLEELYHDQMDGRFTNRDEALAHARRHLQATEK